MRKHGLKILGLALMAAIGLMAFSASSALAVNLNLGDQPFSSGTAGEWLKNSGTLFPTFLNTESVEGKALLGTLLIPGKSAEIHCDEGAITGTVSNEFHEWKSNEMKAGGHGKGTILYLGCKVYKINPTTLVLEGELVECTKELNKELLETLPLNHHITANVLLLVRRHEGKTYLIASPQVNNATQATELEELKLAFATIKFGGVCSLPPTVKVTGCVAAEAPATDSASQLLSIDTHANKTLQELLGCKLKFGANEAFIKGEVHLELSGPEKGTPWGAM